jgi:rhodanese-related sulfurtransferase
MVGNVSSRQAWEALEQEPHAQLVDVRTTAEWSYVGIPELAPLGKRAALIAWQEFPSGEINPAFTADLSRAGLKPDQPVYFLCRSGARSLAAARAAEAAGFAHAFNVADGFEGPPDHEGHRSRVAGWKAEGLPWRQS